MHRLKRLLLFAMALLAAGTLTVPSAQARQLTMCTVNWEPFYGENLPRNGFFTELVREAFERGGHTVNVEFMPWARAMLEVKQGDREVLLGAYYSDERAETYWASEPIYTAEVGLVTLTDVGLESFSSLRELAGYTIGYGRGYIVTEEFDNADYLTKEPAEDLARNVRKLYAGRIDMVAGSFANIRYAAQQQQRDLDRLRFLQPSLKESTLHIMISRAVPDGEQLLADFHRGLRAIREDGTYERILREMGYL
ncbi:MAG: transporter substrate-binding domain-containing protein [Halofilum sp. (in: g-proteobacteria)]|nr:transporter substrate-binding domain-containing protein [Halofilum sp. (in: g-proteobacteria)]